MSIRVESPALITSVQDSGRLGYLRFGLPHSGPMDWRAFRAANDLVGNPPDCACLEIGMTSCALQFQCEALAAACGAGYQLFRGNQAIPPWMSFLVHPGDRLVFDKGPGGNWIYLAVAGGIQSEVWLSSRSVYPRGKLGRHLQAGDQLAVVGLTRKGRLLAGRQFPVSLQPAYTPQPLLQVILGSDLERFDEGALETFFNQTYQVSPQSDRMGYRLTGPPLRHVDGADVVSRGMAMGEIQVPGNGQPIVMMADHPTTGGYSSLGAVRKLDWPLLAQSQPGEGQIRFAPTTAPDAQEALKSLIKSIETNHYEQEDVWLAL
jgi:antagonist of KipI